MGGPHPNLFKPALSMTVTVRMKTVESAEAVALEPGVDRVDDYTVQARVNRQCAVVQ